MPCSPVQALALPLLVTTARIEVDGVRLCDTTTGAATTWLRVYTPAATTGWSATIRARSGFPLGLIPQDTPEYRKPGGNSAVSLLHFGGVSGGLMLFRDLEERKVVGGHRHHGPSIGHVSFATQAPLIDLWEVIDLREVIDLWEAIGDRQVRNGLP